MPSRRKGQRINQSVAPTYFMMAISFLRANTVRRIVFEMIKIAAPVNRIIKAIPIKRIK